MYYVKYAVYDSHGERTVGPYTAEEAKYHRDDIAGYECILYAIIVPAIDDIVEEIMKAFE